MPLPPGYIRAADARCPRDDRAYVIDGNGIRYQIGCSSDTIAGPENGVEVSGSFRDCFDYCYNSLEIFEQPCTSFRYSGGLNGEGPGSCLFMNYEGDGFREAEATQVAAVRQVFAATTTTTTTSTSSSSSSSRIPTTTVHRPL